MTRADHDAKTTPRLSRLARLRNKLIGFTPRKLPISLVLLAVGLIITALVTQTTNANTVATAQHEFEVINTEIQDKITERLKTNSSILQGAAGFIDASETITREKWRTYVERLQIEQQMPGVQGIGFALLIPPEQLDQHIQMIRSEGFPNYSVKPEGKRDVYSSIIYLEPFSDRNLRAFGYDMLSEPIRRAAMEQARDQNNTVLSGKVFLVQENSQDVQYGTLMYVPVYRHGLPIVTVEQRRAAILGWVYSPYRMNNMLNGTLDALDARLKKMDISLQVYDGDLISTDTLLYDSQGNTDKARVSTARFSKTSLLALYGHHWTLLISERNGLASTIDKTAPWIVFFVGTVISLLLSGLIFSLLRTLANSKQLAIVMTTDLRMSEQKFQTIINSADDIVFTLDLEQRYTGVYGNWVQKMQRTPEYFLGRTSHDIIGEQDLSGRDRFEANQRVLAGGGSADYMMVMKIGEKTRFFHMISSALRNESNEVSGILSLGREVTQFMEMEEALRYSNQMLASVAEVNVKRTNELALANNYLENLINYANAPIIVWDSQFRITRFNHAFETLTGRTEAEMLGQTPEVLFPPTLAENSMAQIRNISIGERWEWMEIKILHRDGSVRTVLWNSATLYEPDGKTALATIAQGMDITQRKLIEESLLQNELRYRTVVDMSPYSIVVCEGRGGGG